MLQGFPCVRLYCPWLPQCAFMLLRLVGVLPCWPWLPKRAFMLLKLPRVRPCWPKISDIIFFLSRQTFLWSRSQSSRFMTFLLHFSLFLPLFPFSSVSPFSSRKKIFKPFSWFPFGRGFSWREKKMWISVRIFIDVDNKINFLFFLLFLRCWKKKISKDE